MLIWFATSAFYSKGKLSKENVLVSKDVFKTNKESLNVIHYMTDTIMYALHAIQ